MSAVNFCRQGTCISFLVLLVALICLSAVRAQFTCDTSRYLNDAGFGTVTEYECTSRGFCWDPSVPTGKPWCFVPNGGYNSCSGDSQRNDCGFYGINQQFCEGRGCCWVEYGDGPWCFFQNVNNAAT
eukprot:g6213.t1